MTDMQGKVVLITGASNGIGRAAALALARTGATVALAGRDEKRVDTTVAMIREQSDNDEVKGLLADLSNLTGMRQLANEFRRRYSRLDLLLNNAGAAFHERAETVDGIERTFALNHLAYYQLSRRLLDMLQRSAPARIVNVSSDAHRQVKVFDFDNIDGRKAWGMRGFTPYAQSKLANLLFTRELARRVAGTGVTVNALHPGVVATDIFRDTGGPIGFVFHTLGPLFMKKPEQGADTLVWAGNGGRGRGRERRLLRGSQAARALGGGARRRRGAASVGAQRGVVRDVGGLMVAQRTLMVIIYWFVTIE